MVEKLVYFVCFPALLWHRLYYANWSAGEVQQVLIAVTALIAAGTLLIILLIGLFRWPWPQGTGALQGTIRFNSFVGLAAVSQLMGEAGLPMAATVMALMIPLVNVICVLAFTLAGSRKSATSGLIIKGILTNPLILGCLLGFSWKVLSLPMPEVLSSSLDLLGSTALPLGLMAVGAGLQLKSLHGYFSLFVLTSVVKLIAFPLVAYLLCDWLNISATTTNILIVIAALPTASSAYILARQLGGDAPLMASIISGQTLLAMGTMPVILSLLL